MATKIQINIDLALIPEGAIKAYHREGGKDSRYTYLDVAEMRQPDDKGNTHSVSVYFNGERTYIGKGKVITFGEGAPAQAPAPAKAAPARPKTTPKVAPAEIAAEGNDLPF